MKASFHSFRAHFTTNSYLVVIINRFNFIMYTRSADNLSNGDHTFMSLINLTCKKLPEMFDKGGILQVFLLRIIK